MRFRLHREECFCDYCITISGADWRTLNREFISPFIVYITYLIILYLLVS
jgi:hypothetical protein